MAFAVITENDTSAWKDETGVRYHFPSRYHKLLSLGTKILYYKGRLKDLSFKEKRLSPEPHYFGTAEIGKVYPDNQSSKNDLFCDVVNFIPFTEPVLAKQGEDYFENIPDSRINNYWRDGVREISEEVFNNITKGSTIDDPTKLNNDLMQGLEASFQSYLEGSAKLVISTKYERNPFLRQQALLIHGYSCMACGFNFGKFYGEYGKGFIHVHHTRPLGLHGETVVNAKNDLIVLCANCHAMVHRRINYTLTLDDLKEMIRQNGKK